MLHVERNDFFFMNEKFVILGELALDFLKVFLFKGVCDYKRAALSHHRIGTIQKGIHIGKAVETLNAQQKVEEFPLELRDLRKFFNITL